MVRQLNTKLIKLVNILKDQTYHDGNTIGEILKMSRSAVWKCIKKLEHLDIPIASIKGKGYALLEPLTLLERNKIKQRLHDDKIDLQVYESVHSTNDYLKSIKTSKAIKICLAEQQTQGRGRWGREWYSPFGKNVYISCLYTFQKDISELAGLSMATTLAIVKTLKQYGIREHLFVKWPNDVIYENKKLSGSLIDVQAETHRMSKAIIGIGLNVNIVNADKQITQGWTSMRKVLGEYIDRNLLCAELINNLMHYLGQFERHGFSHFVDEWMRSDAFLNKTITLKNINHKIKGKVTGINEQGHLLLQLPNGTIQSFSSGDASIMKKMST